ncbi:MAG TPA: carbohydrate binding domain-containing protein, partial [Polyangia bacterium]
MKTFLAVTPTLALLALVPATSRADGTMTAGASTPAGKNMVWNGEFDRDSLRPWSVMFDSSRFGSAAVTNGELCFKLAEASARGVDVIMRQRPMAVAKGHHYQLRLKTHATAPTKLRVRLSKINAP